MFETFFPYLCDCMYHMCIVPSEVRREYQTSLELKLDSCKTPNVGANTEPRSSGRAVHIRNCWVISSTYILIFFKENSFSFFSSPL